MPHPYRARASVHDVCAFPLAFCNSGEVFYDLTAMFVCFIVKFLKIEKFGFFLVSLILHNTIDEAVRCFINFCSLWQNSVPFLKQQKLSQSSEQDPSASHAR